MNLNLGNICFVILLIFALLLSVFDFELYGNVFRFLPIIFLIYLISIKDFNNFFLLLISFASSLFITYSIKAIIYFILLIDADKSRIVYLLTFAIRPINGYFSGFPSGHSTTAFVAVAFAYIYLKLKWKILIFILATFVAISRILNLWHTPFQVFVGSMIGFFITLYIIKNIKIANFLKFK